MHKLLLITPYFPPSAASGSFRALGFANHLPKFGWEVTVVASGPRPWEPNDVDLLKQLIADTTIHYVDFPLGEARRIHHQLMQRLRIKGCTDVWNAPTLRRCREVIAENRPDVIITSGPPHNVHLIGRAIQKQFAIPWVADFRDPWCSWGGETPYVNNTFLLERYWEGGVFRHADLIVANTANTAEMFKRVFPQSARRIQAVSNGYDPINRTTEPSTDTSSECFVLLHTGSVYAGRNPRSVAEAVRALGGSSGILGKRICLRLVGQCLDDKLMTDVEKGHLQQWVEIVPPVSYAAAADQMLTADVLILLDSPGRRIGVPAKLYEYIGAQKPVLALAAHDSDTAKLLQDSGLTHRIVSDWHDLDAIQNAIVALITGPTKEGLPISNNGSFTRESQSRLLCQFMEPFASNKNGDAAG